MAWHDALSKKHQLRGMGAGKESSRTPAKRTHCGLHSHMSKAEAECCQYFQFLEKQGQLKIEKVQPNVPIPEACTKIIPDWLLRYPDGSLRYADYKGFETQFWKRNRKLWKLYGPYPLEVWKSKGDRFFVSETITKGE